MAEVINGLGTALTTLIKTMSQVWAWLSTPLNIFGWEGVTPLALVTGSLIAVLGYVLIRSLIV